MNKWHMKFVLKKLRKLTNVDLNYIFMWNKFNELIKAQFLSLRNNNSFIQISNKKEIKTVKIRE